MSSVLFFCPACEATRDLDLDLVEDEARVTCLACNRDWVIRLVDPNLTPAPIGSCPAGGEHEWPTGAESYTGVCLKCGQGR